MHRSWSTRSRRGRSAALATGIACLALAGGAQAAPVFVPGPKPTAPFGGTVIDFEGFDEGTLIDNQYAGQGVTFTQDVGGRPQIDNQPMLFAYGPESGVAVLTGSTEGGDPFPTVAGLKAVFNTPVARAGAYMSDTAPLGDYPVTAFDAVGNVLESQTVPGSAFPSPSNANCSSFFPPGSEACGVFVGFDRSTADIKSIQFGRSTAFGDSFAIDDLRFPGGGHRRPGPPHRHHGGPRSRAVAGGGGAPNPAGP
jgi:hypothetical protein